MSDVEVLRALADHMEACGLSGTTCSAGVPCGYKGASVQVQPPRTLSSHTPVLLAWVETLHDVSITVTMSDVDFVHLHARGLLPSGTDIRVVAVLSGADRAALRAAMTVEVGAPVDVAVLRRIAESYVDSKAGA